MNEPAYDARTLRLALLACAALVLLAFHPLWLYGDSCMAAQASPGVTLRGPVGATNYGQLPLADTVASCIDEPQAVLASAQLRAGHFPWWNPHNGLGVPLFGNWQSSLLSPLRALVLACPDGSWAFDVTYVLRLLLAACGACWLALHLGVGAVGAVASGITFGLTGYFLRYLSMHHLNAEVWLPWLWLCADRLAISRRLRDLIAFVAVAFCVVVGGNPQPTLVAGLATIAFALWRARHWGIAGLLWVAAAGLAPLLLASSYWLAGLEYVHESVHHHTGTVGQDAFTAAGALGLFLPYPYGEPGPIGMVAPHLGFLPWALAVLGLGRLGLGRSVFLWALLLLTAGKLLNLPGTAWLGELPGLAMMKFYKYAYPVPALALALLAGSGVAALREGCSPAQLGVRLVVAAVPLVALLLAGAQADAALEPLRLDPGVRLAWLAALLAGVVAALRLGSAPWRSQALLALLALELLSAWPQRWLPRLEPFAKPDFVRAIRERDASARTFAAGGLLLPNQNAVFGLDDIRLHDGVFPRRYGKLVRGLLNPNVRLWPVFTGEDLGERDPRVLELGLQLQRLLMPQQIAAEATPSVPVDLDGVVTAKIFDLLNVEYFLLPAVGRRLVEQWRKGRYEVVHDDAEAVVVRRKTALPRAFVPARVEFVADEDAAFARLAAPDFDPKAVAYLEGEGPDAAATAPSSGTARVINRPTPGDLTIAVQTGAPAWVVISVYPYPGLSATVDGKPAPLRPANGALCAVQVPRGQHELRLTYVPTTLSRATWLTAAGAALLLMLALACRRAATPHGGESGVLG